MKNKKMKPFLLMLALCSASASVYALPAMSDDDLAAVTGQNLFVADIIQGAAGTPGAGFTYTRMGLNAEVALNANINKLQLGCGGYNEIVATGCDIDIDFLSLMGRSATEGGTPATGATAGTKAAAAGSDFTLTRPYVEIVTTGNTASTREVVGFKLGAQSANGYFGVGRFYNAGETNQEHGGVCGNDAGLNCHSGINSLSGYINIRMQGQADGCFSLTGAGLICINGSGPVATFDQWVPLIGTRMKKAEIVLNTTSFIGIPVVGTVSENLRFVHGFALVNTPDFGLTFQRQQVAHPTYSTSSSSATQSYSPLTNAGWGFSIPSMELTGLYTDVGNQSLGAIAGITLTDQDLGQRPPSNCFGSSKFC